MIRITYDEGDKLLHIEMKDVTSPEEAAHAYMAIYNGMMIHFANIFGHEAMERMVAMRNAMEAAGMIGFGEEDADDGAGQGAEGHCDDCAEDPSLRTAPEQSEERAGRGGGPGT